MTKEEFKEEYIDSGKRTWDKLEDFDFEYMYNDLHFIDSAVAEIFEVPLIEVIRKRKEVGASIKKEDYGALEKYKQQGYLKWDGINYDRFDYLYIKCNFTDGMIADLFDVPKSTVTKKRKEFGITMGFSTGYEKNDVSSYLDFVDEESTGL